MNYTELRALALSYSDREDAEVSDRIDDFIKIVESRVNRKLKTNDMSVRAQINLVNEQEYYGLPDDFSAIRDIEVQSVDGSTRSTLSYCSPEQMNQIKTSSSSMCSYTIIADQLQVNPIVANNVLEIVYYQKVPNISTTAETNWLGDFYPDCYVFGILVEINSFVKDAEAALLWDSRFKEALSEIQTIDRENRWSGTSLQTRAG